jgi:hypothetical protein
MKLKYFWVLCAVSAALAFAGCQPADNSSSGMSSTNQPSVTGTNNVPSRSMEPIPPATNGGPMTPP